MKKVDNEVDELLRGIFPATPKFVGAVSLAGVESSEDSLPAIGEVTGVASVIGELIEPNIRRNAEAPSPDVTESLPDVAGNVPCHVFSFIVRSSSINCAAT